MYISKVRIKNIHCFKEIILDFNNESGPILWTTLLGDNSTGKTTLLKCIALGLCDESSAAGLLRESEEGFLRQSSELNGKVINLSTGSIEVTLKKRNSNKVHKINTFITRKESGHFTFEKLSQTTEPKNNFPWKDIFICAYGIGRGMSGTGDISGYVPISAVYNLFNYGEGLQNPELVMRRIIDDESKSDKIFYEQNIYEILKGVMNLPNANIELTVEGIKIEDDSFPKKMSLRDIADGYKSTLQWVTDYIGWLISFRYQTGRNKKKDMEGILLIDAIEEHLHPKWQKSVVNRLKEKFPGIQFVTTSHSPIIAKSVGMDTTDKAVNNQLLLLEIGDDNNVNDRNIGSLKGFDIDQILGSEAFDYQFFQGRRMRFYLNYLV